MKDISIGDLKVVHKRGRSGGRKRHDEKVLQKLMQLYFVERFSLRKVADILGLSHMSVYRMLSDPSLEVLI